MNILVIGNGGREHAICWKLKHSKEVKHIYCAPGNAGTAAIGSNVNIKATDIKALMQFVRKEAIDLTVVGPEAPLAEGIVDEFTAAGLRVFGPTKAAAQLETSKAFAKDFMKRHHIPTAAYMVFHAGETERLRDYLMSQRYPLVLKADGLAAGKGVIIAQSFDEAMRNGQSMLEGSAFGDAGTTLVVEEFLKGPEASVFALTDGTRFVTLAPAQDHKRILDNDLGKNTGGMGAFAPTPYVPTELLADVKMRVIKRVIDGMRADGIPYSGVLFVGLMLTEDGPKVLEFNCRFGDPETQVVLPLIDYDLGVLLRDIADGKLQLNRLPLHDANAVCVVMASSGYPDAYETGKPIAGLDAINEEEEGVLVFHAGTRKEGERIVTAGGRVLGVTALAQGSDLAASIRLAYNAVNRIRFDGAYYRTDIGRKALQ
ncbi:MAG: phosphoribosylamine--glycine ligase [Bacteroidetes bacterium]|nr:phosphoribosylamine--glycine ligase [Bacteroidota bacterium]